MQPLLFLLGLTATSFAAPSPLNTRQYEICTIKRDDAVLAGAANGTSNPDVANNITTASDVILKGACNANNQLCYFCQSSGGLATLASAPCLTGRCKKTGNDCTYTTSSGNVACF